jgi:DNA repair ATPase RecN
MLENLSRETRKLEVRLDAFLKEEDAFLGELRRCINKLKELERNLRDFEKKAGSKESSELLNIRLETINSFSRVLKKQGESEHEKSHLLESYGSLLHVIEEEFKEILNR